MAHRPRGGGGCHKGCMRMPVGGWACIGAPGMDLQHSPSPHCPSPALPFSSIAPAPKWHLQPTVTGPPVNCDPPSVRPQLPSCSLQSCPQNKITHSRRSTTNKRHLTARHKHRRRTIRRQQLMANRQTTCLHLWSSVEEKEIHGPRGQWGC